VAGTRRLEETPGPGTDMGPGPLWESTGNVW
jgi:hypothetical protein